MFRKILQSSIKGRNIVRPITSDSRGKEAWDLYAAVLVERHPIVSKALNPMEDKFQKYLSHIEFEKSLKSDHELKHERDLLQTELIKKGEMEIDLDDTSSKQTAQDLKDAYVEEFKKFELAPRITDADSNKNLLSTNRSLENTLYLLIEQKLSDKTHFILPQGKREDGETLRQTAERVLRENCGKNMEVAFYGNAPCGFYKYKYPANERKHTLGAKIFFFRSFLKNGNVDSKCIPKYQWLERESLHQQLRGSYAESVEQFLI